MKIGKSFINKINKSKKIFRKKPGESPGYINFYGGKRSVSFDNFN